MFEQWRISSSDGACCRCQAEFPVGGVFFSALAEQDPGLVRHDFCCGCWQGLGPEGSVREGAGGFFCFWRTRRAPSETKPVVGAELMLDFFDRLHRPDSEEKVIFRFVLALYLTRRRELKLLEVVRGPEGESLVLQRRAGGAKVEVRNPELTEQQVQAAAAQLGRLFDAEL